MKRRRFPLCGKRCEGEISRSLFFPRVCHRSDYYSIHAEVRWAVEGYNESFINLPPSPLKLELCSKCHGATIRPINKIHLKKKRGKERDLFPDGGLFSRVTEAYSPSPLAFPLRDVTPQKLPLQTERTDVISLTYATYRSR